LRALLEALRSSQRCSRADLDDYDSRLGYALHNYGSVLETIGNTESACSAMREAVRTRQSLAERNSDTQNANLATSLYEYGWLLSKLGRSEEAVPPTRECVTIYQKLASSQETYKPQLARATYDLSVRLWETTSYDEALTAMRQGIGLQREITENCLSGDTPELASFLETFSVMLTQRRLETEAATAAEEAAHLRRQP
jgi:tetratricopeptide (TPR) repeat protein